MSVIERHAEDLGNGGIPVRLHVVDALRDETEVEELIRVGVIEKPVG